MTQHNQNRGNRNASFNKQMDQTDNLRENRNSNIETGFEKGTQKLDAREEEYEHV